jgi:hypothetical protein
LNGNISSTSGLTFVTITKNGLTNINIDKDAPDAVNKK